METENYHVQSSLLDSFIGEIKNLRDHCIIFHFSLEDITPDNGKKIEKIVDMIEKENLNMFLTFVPPCVFRPDKKSLKRFLCHNQTPVFTCEDLGVTQVLTKEGRDLIPLSRLYEKCVDCNYRLDGECGGIYIKKTEESESRKLFEWYYEYLNKLNEGKVLDLGSGITPYLSFYEEFVLKNDRLVFICLDPFKFAVRVLDNKIKGKGKIMQVCGLGEDIPFGENLFDVVLMQSSYAHFFNLEKVLENVYKSLKNNGRLVIFEEHAPILEKTEFWTKHYRDHTLKEAISEIKKHKFRVLDRFKHKESWGVLAVKC